MGEVLKKILGYSSGKIERLKEKGVLKPAD